MVLYFEVQKKASERADHRNSVTETAKLPGFVLCHNYNWDDNQLHNWYCVHYFDESGNWYMIGDMHLMHVSGESYPQLPLNFTSLSDEFCSLGNKIDYYERMYRVLGTELSKEVLASLQDCAVNLVINEKYKGNETYRLSLRREAFDTERALRLGRFAINGRKMNQAFQFDYLYSPPYNKQCVTEWTVNFKTGVQPFLRMAGIIGENGVGKTQMLSLFIKDLLAGNANVFKSDLPIFSCIIAVCSTPFDEFMNIESRNYTMPYIKSCVEQNKTETEEKVFLGAQAINERGYVGGRLLISFYVNRLKKELPTENIDSAFVAHDNEIGIEQIWEIERDNLNKIIKNLSSGQLQILMLLTTIYEHVNYDSLFVIDEPEVHLHPNAIMSFLRMLSSLLDEFQSYAIITTHSPLVVREMVGRNVFIMSRLEKHNVYIGHCDRETFGEDIGILYRDIFGYDDTESCFREQVRELINDGDDYDEVINDLGVENLSLNSRFTIRNMVLEFKKQKPDEKQ